MSKRIDPLAMIAIIGWAFFATSAVLLPLFSGYSFAGDYISELAIGRFGYIQTVAFFTAGLGSLALALVIRETTRGVWGSRAGSVLVSLFGINVILAGTVHVVVSLLAFAGMFVFSRTFKRDARWRPYWPFSLAFAALITFFLVSDGQWIGLYQRIFIGTIVLWLILAAMYLHSIARSVPTGRVAPVG